MPRKFNGSSPKRRGDLYERDVARFLSIGLFNEPDRVRRAPLSGGGAHLIDGISGKGTGQADLVGAPGIHVECKRTNKLRLYEAMAQAESSIRTNHAPEKPVVITRKDGLPTEDSLVIMRLSDWLPMYDAWCVQSGYIKRES